MLKLATVVVGALMGCVSASFNSGLNSSVVQHMSKYQPTYKPKCKVENVTYYDDDECKTIDQSKTTMWNRIYSKHVLYAMEYCLPVINKKKDGVEDFD